MSTPTGYDAETRGPDGASGTSSFSSTPARVQNGSSVPARPRSTETKASFKTTELMVFAAAVIGVLLASFLVKTTNLHGDYFRADKAWFYIVILSVGYMISRGLAKSGSREHYDGS